MTKRELPPKTEDQFRPISSETKLDLRQSGKSLLKNAFQLTARGNTSIIPGERLYVPATHQESGKGLHARMFPPEITSDEIIARMDKPRHGRDPRVLQKALTERMTIWWKGRQPSATWVMRDW